MRGALHVLLIDDDPVYAFVFRRLVERTGTVQLFTICPTAEEALRYLETHAAKNQLPDVVFVDLNMPGMSGWDFLTQYRQAGFFGQPPPRMYIVSSSVAPGDLAEASNTACISGYFAKPMSARQLANVLGDVDDDDT